MKQMSLQCLVFALRVLMKELSPTQVPQKYFEMWPNPFLLQYMVKLTKSELSVQLRVSNTGSKTFKFTALLHTYFAVQVSL